MNRGLYICRKNYLIGLIKKQAKIVGENDMDFLNEYCKQIIENHPDELIERPIECFEKLLGDNN